MQTGTLWFRGLTASQGIHLVSLFRPLAATATLRLADANEGQVPTLGQSNQCGSGANKSQKQQFAYCTATGEVPGPRQLGAISARELTRPSVSVTGHPSVNV